MSTGGTNELEKRNEGDTLLGRGFPGMDERGSEGFSNGLEGGFCGGEGSGADSFASIWTDG